MHDLITQRRVARAGQPPGRRRTHPAAASVFPDAVLDPDVAVPGRSAKEWARDEALREIVRGRLEGLGPTTAARSQRHWAWTSPTSTPRCSRWKPKATAMRGNFEPDSPTPVQWCDRRLLARIHRYTVKRLRAEIEPVQARDFLRFLFDWQRVTPTTRMQGPDAVPAVLGQLEGFDAPASAWETEVLPARIAEYDPAWLDEQCLAGRIVWTRLATRAGDAERGAAPVRSTPIALLRPTQRAIVVVVRGSSRDAAAHAEGTGSRRVHPGAWRFVLRRDRRRRRLLPTQVEEALAELVALGIVNSDSFGGLRALLVPADRRRPTARDARRKRRIAIFGMQDAGRWALVEEGSGAEPRARTSSTCAGRCCAAGASCSGSCSSARRIGCRRGGRC